LRKVRTTIYVAVNPDDLHRLRPLLALFFQQAIGLQTQQLPEHNPELVYQLLFLLDEVAALGRIPIISEALSYLPGYDVRLLLIFQALSQLREVYGPHAAATMLKSLAARIVFAPKDFDESKEISDELGDRTAHSRSTSRPRFAQWGGRGASAHGGNITVSDQRRPLMLPQEVRELGTDKALIFYEGLRPILARKVRYFADRRFRARLLPPPVQPVAADAALRHTAESADTKALLRAGLACTSATEAGAELNRANAASGVDVDRPTPASDPEEIRMREPTLDDLPRLDSLTLEDFGGKFENVKVPEGRPATETEIQAAVDQFLADLSAQ
jgi:type IV secretion system protein VirD4